jgi:Concanavalin A-like lectin/glucanases superfamily
MNWWIVLGVSFVIILTYILYKYFQNYTTVASNMVNLNQVIPSILVTNNPISFQYSVGAWIYVNSWNNNNYKPLISIPNQFNIYLDKTSPTLYFDISQNCGTNNVNPTPPIVISDDFPIQRWTYACVVVDNFFIDMYLDGKLMQSVKLNCMQSFPNQANTSVYLGGNPAVLNDIMMSKVYRWSYTLAPRDVWNNYIAGNGVSTSFSSYGMAIDVLKNNTVQNSIRLF